MARESRGISQRELADASGVSLRTIVYLEGGKANNIGIEKVLTLFKVLSIEMWISDSGGDIVENKNPGRMASYDDAMAYMFGGGNE